MRKDIEVHINTGDISLVSTNKVTLMDFAWVDKPDSMEERYIYGEVTIPAAFSASSITTNGVYIYIPYTPVYKEIRLRFKRNYGSVGLDTYITNPSDGSLWFGVQASIYGERTRNIFASELITISENNFYISFIGDTVKLFSGVESDVNIVRANLQNKNMLLSCVPGGNYRYPLTGVGLIRWANSNIDVSNLAEILKKEFADDGTPVKSAEYNHELRHLKLILDTTSVDSNGNV